MSERKVESVVGEGAEHNSQTAMDGVSRRKLLRAGLAAAPVVATLHSTPVLANTGGGVCIRPSSFSSFKTTEGFRVSRARAADVDQLRFGCDSVDAWKSKYLTKTTWIWGKGNVTGPDTTDATTVLLCKPVRDYSPQSGSKLSTTETRTFYKILCDGSEKEKRTVALYLTAATTPSTALLTTRQCADYWSQGYFSPFSTIQSANEYVNAMTGSGVVIRSL